MSSSLVCLAPSAPHSLGDCLPAIPEVAETCSAAWACASLSVHRASTAPGRVVRRLGWGLLLLSSSMLGVLFWIASYPVHMLMICRGLRQMGGAAHWRAWLRAIHAESVALGLTVATFPLSPLLRSDREQVASLPVANATVVLLHGMAHSPAAWTFLQSRLERKGFCCVNLALPPLDGVIESGKALETRCRSLRESGRRLVFVGHSRGGFIAAWLAAQGLASGLVTIGTALAGVQKAWWKPTAAIREILPGGKALTEIRDSASFQGIPRLAIAGQADLVADPENCLQHGSSALTLGCGHLAPLFSSTLAERVEEFVCALSQSVQGRVTA